MRSRWRLRISSPVAGVRSGIACRARLRRSAGGQAPRSSRRIARPPPKPGPPPALKLPAIQKRTLSNGLPVWIVELHKVPVVHVSLVVKAGSGADPREQVRRRAPDRGDARRRRRRARRAADCRRHRLPRREPVDLEHVRRDVRGAARAGRAPRRRAADHGGRGAAADVPGEGAAARARGAADVDRPGAGRSRRRSSSSRFRGSSSARSTATARCRSGPRRR